MNHVRVYIYMCIYIYICVYIYMYIYMYNLSYMDMMQPYFSTADCWLAAPDLALPPCDAWELGNSPPNGHCNRDNIGNWWLNISIGFPKHIHYVPFISISFHWYYVINVHSFLHCGAPQVISWFINSMDTIVVSIINYSYWSYVHQLSYLGSPTL